MREHYAAPAAQKFAPPAPEPLPAFVANVVGAFAEIRGRKSSAFGVQPISDSDVLSWSALRREALRAWEIRAVFAMDRAYRVGLATGDVRND